MMNDTTVKKLDDMISACRSGGPKDWDIILGDVSDDTGYRYEFLRSIVDECITADDARDAADQLEIVISVITIAYEEDF